MEVISDTNKGITATLNEKKKFKGHFVFPNTSVVILILSSPVLF
jgi:hypothetical protein